MQRLLEDTLLSWKTRAEHLPLLLRGARQVGKSHLVEHFGKAHFGNSCVINFERNPEYEKCFDSFNPKEILQKIALLKNESIIPGQTLVFLDEIQVCPRAIQALRYFKEEIPELHVIGAGSLLEFSLNAPDFKMPVGRVQYLYLKPLSFHEYLYATGKNAWVDAIRSATLAAPLPEVVHDALLKEIKIYMALGGMPAVVSKYIEQKSGELFQPTQKNILATYIDDFAKYASSAKHPYLRVVFEQLPRLIGQQTKYSKIDPDIHSRFLKEAIQTLEMAGILYKVHASAASGIPIHALSDFKKYKLFFLDIGLMSAKIGLSAEILLNDDVMNLKGGAMAEQFVAQELLAAQAPFEQASLHYWARPGKNSQAEVDFVMQYETHIVPIEVKAGHTGQLKSLHLMMQEKNLPIGVRVSQQALNLDTSKKILSVPFYMVSEIERLISSNL